MELYKTRQKTIPSVFVFLFLFSISYPCIAADKQQIDFFATVSATGDKNMVSMTTDLFFTKVQTLGGYSVVDKRDTPYSKDKVSANIAFYAEINENSDGTWQCTLNAIKIEEDKAISETKNYDSYYKILLDAKSSVENIMANIEGNTTSESLDASQNRALSGVNIDSLAGTWKGEDSVDKVIIMRGGRGFVIFKNGASMTVSISVNGKTVSVIQNGRSNASYYPDLPRELALKNAATASPIKWDLTLTSSSTLKGTKTTLVENTDSENGVKKGTFNVEWTKQ